MVRGPICRSDPRLQAFRTGMILLGSWVVVGGQELNKLTRLDLQGVGPHQVTVRRDITVPVLKLRYETVAIDSHCVGQFALGHSALLYQLAYPKSRLSASLLRLQLGRPLPYLRVHIKNTPD